MPIAEFPVVGGNPSWIAAVEPMEHFMASLAPGNGWYPNRPYSGPRPGYAPRRGYTNVYVFPRPRPVLTVVKDAPAVTEAHRPSPDASPEMKWPVASFIVGALAWLGLVGALVAAAIGMGVPLLTAVATLAATHLLAATLALLIGVRVGRKLLAEREPGHK